MNGTGMFTIEVAGQRHDFDDAQLAAIAFLARYSGRTLDAYRHDLRDFFAARLGGIVAASGQAVESLQATVSQDEGGRTATLAALRRNQQQLAALMAEAAGE